MSNKFTYLGKSKKRKCNTMVTESSMSYLHCSFLDEDAFNFIASINIIVSTPDMVKKNGQGQLQPRHEISTFTSTTNISSRQVYFFKFI